MGIGQTLHGLPLAAWIRGSPWAYPAVETVHIVALALLFGSIVLVDLRLLGVSRALPATDLLHHALPVSMLAFTLAAATGSLLFLTHADDLVGNRVFVLKMGLIMLAGINAAVFHAGAGAGVRSWDSGSAAPLAARVGAGVSLALWTGVIACGRWIAYA